MFVYIRLQPHRVTFCSDCILKTIKDTSGPYEISLDIVRENRYTVVH